jgi:bacterioferritin-associated ferredoxin
LKTREMIICRCEEVTLEEVMETARLYTCSARELKLRTRAGMGYCGGRTCRPLMDTLIQRIAGQESPHDVPLGYQPPVRPVSFHLLGGGK